MAKIIVIEDERNLRYSVRKILERAGHTISDTDTVDDAWRIVQKSEPDLVITDVNLEAGGDGLDLVRRLRGDGFSGPIVVMTAYGSIESAIQAMKDGADEYLQKPLSMEELQVVVDRALENRRVRNRLNLYERLEKTRSTEEELLGESEAWKQSLKLAERLASLPIGSANDLSTILLLGETGVGKGMLARYIHRISSPSAKAPFVHVNCSALPPTLIEAELFGHEKGAFTDAKEARQGLFELADGGTIFLDEIGDMPVELQSKLLVVVEHGRIRRVGGSKERTVNARIIAATNHDLATQVEKNRFRRDLYYRLNALTIPIPPLRQRDGDGLVIADSLVRRARKKFGRPALELSPEAVEAIREHSWPGNVRELANAIHRAALLAPRDVIEPADLGLAAAPSVPGTSNTNQARRKVSTPARPEELTFDFESGAFTAEAVERRLIVVALEHSHGNVSRAAKLIGMNRSSLRYRLERYSLEELVQEIAAR